MYMHLKLLLSRNPMLSSPHQQCNMSASKTMCPIDGCSIQIPIEIFTLQILHLTPVDRLKLKCWLFMVYFFISRNFDASQAKGHELHRLFITKGLQLKVNWRLHEHFPLWSIYSEAVLQRSFEDLRSSKIFSRRSIFVFVFGPFQIVEESSKLRRF